MNEHDRIELQRLATQSGALGNQIKYAPKRRPVTSGVNWRRIALWSMAGAVLVGFVALAMVMPWGSAAQFVQFPSWATVVPCVLCRSFAPCRCDLGELCERTAALTAADTAAQHRADADRRARERSMRLPDDFQVIWPNESQVA